MIQYKTVPGPVGLTINRKEDYESAVRQCASIIDAESVGGWKFEFIQRIPVTKKAGCLASIFGRGDTTVFFNMLVFSKDDSSDINSSVQISSEISGIESQLATEKTDIVTADKGSRVPNADSVFEINISRDTASEISGNTYNNSPVSSNVNKKKIAVFAGVAVVALIIGILISNINVKDDYYKANYDQYSDYGNKECNDSIGWIDAGVAVFYVPDGFVETNYEGAAKSSGVRTYSYTRSDLDMTINVACLIAPEINMGVNWFEDSYDYYSQVDGITYNTSSENSFTVSGYSESEVYYINEVRIGDQGIEVSIYYPAANKGECDNIVGDFIGNLSY